LSSELHNRVVVITGGGTGIGAGIAAALGSAGARVHLLGRRQATLQQVASSIKGPYPIHTFPVDVSNRPQVDEVFASIVSSSGPVEILVNSAGMNIQNRTMADMRPEQWDEVLQCNVTGAYNTMHAVLPSMRSRKSGLIINISSVAGKRAIQLGGVAYAASKFAMTALGTAVSNEVRGDGVRVTNVYPGEVNTPILDRRPVPVPEEHRQSILQPEDVGALVLMIASLPPRAHIPEVVIKPTRQEWF
jgi:NADP-dependent 3-hydroxy acid dehydrogenase YdfG